SSLTATAPLPSQSPLQRADTGVFVGLAEHFPTPVPVGFGPGLVEGCGVLVGAKQPSRPRMQVGVGVITEPGVSVVVGVGEGVGVSVGTNGFATAMPRRPSAKSNRNTTWRCSLRLLRCLPK